jgi:hypothetical protein
LQRRVRHVMAQTDSLAHLILASLRYERRPLATGAQSQPPQPSMQ